MPVAIVTDSASSLPPELARVHRVVVVPLRLIAGGQVFDDDGAAGQEPYLCSTARPTPARFEAAYRQAAQGGATAVVSVHLPRQLSGTIGSAELAAATAAVPVLVVDGQSIGLGLGLCVLAAARAAAAGRSAADVAALASELAGLTRTFFAVDRADVLLAGGRLASVGAGSGSGQDGGQHALPGAGPAVSGQDAGRAVSALGAGLGAGREVSAQDAGQAAPALFSRPVLELAGGRISLAERVRTRAVAAERLGWLAAAAAGERPVDIAVQHYQAGERAAELAERLRASVPGLAELRVAPAGAVLAAHAGPGMLGVAVVPHPADG